MDSVACGMKKTLPTKEQIASVMAYLGGLGGRSTERKVRHTSFNVVNASVNGRKGGSAGFGTSKVRGNKSYYAAIAKKRWQKKVTYVPALDPRRPQVG